MVPKLEETKDGEMSIVSKAAWQQRLINAGRLGNELLRTPMMSPKREAVLGRDVGKLASELKDKVPAISQLDSSEILEAMKAIHVVVKEDAKEKPSAKPTRVVATHSEIEGRSVGSSSLIRQDVELTPIHEEIQQADNHIIALSEFKDKGSAEGDEINEFDTVESTLFTPVEPGVLREVEFNDQLAISANDSKLQKMPNSRPTQPAKERQIVKTGPTAREDLIFATNLHSKLMRDGFDVAQVPPKKGVAEEDTADRSLQIREDILNKTKQKDKEIQNGGKVDVLEGAAVEVSHKDDDTRDNDAGKEFGTVENKKDELIASTDVNPLPGGRAQLPENMPQISAWGQEPIRGPLQQQTTESVRETESITRREGGLRPLKPDAGKHKMRDAKTRAS